MYEVDNLEDLYNGIINDKDLTNKEKIKELESIIQIISNFSCYNDFKTNCPYSEVFSIDEENRSIEIECKYSDTFKTVNDNLDRFDYCPYSKLESDCLSMIHLLIK